jgi:hypothetical protein
MNTPRRLRLAPRALTAGVLFVALALSATAQDDGTRNLWDTEFLQKRPQAATAPKKSPTYRRKKRASPIAPQAAKTQTPLASDAVVGVTIWRLRPSSTSDAGAARILVHDEADDADVEWTPERVNTDTPLAEGQRVRLAIEVPRNGHLYVINRELMEGGAYGKTHLIFPTLRLGGGANSVEAGSVVEIPAQTDVPSYFTLERNGTKHVGEEILLLVTPEPLAELKIGRSAIELAPEQVAEWERKWGGAFEQLDLDGGAGMTYTAAEKAAGAGGAARLSQADPLPQSIFRVAAKPGSPFLVRVPLRIK